VLRSVKRSREKRISLQRSSTQKYESKAIKPRVVCVVNLAELVKDLRAEHVDPAAYGVTHKGLGLLRIVEDLVVLIADNATKVLGEIPGHLRLRRKRGEVRRKKLKKTRKKRKEKKKKGRKDLSAK